MIEHSKSTVTGCVTLPAETGMESHIQTLAEKWGVDTIRDSDGTQLSPELLSLGFKIYSTICMVRADNEWAKKHPECCMEHYLLSDSYTAMSDQLEIEPLCSYHQDQFEIDTRHDPQKWWQIINRTTGEIIDPKNWKFNPTSNTVQITNTHVGHVYTVSFLAYKIWDSTSMFNHMTNNWTSEHLRPIDPRHPNARQHLLGLLDQWLKEHPQTDVVRLTALIYHFTMILNHKADYKYYDWYGYLDCVSPLALKDFEEEKGYQLTPEDLIDQGYYNNPNRIPTKQYLDWMDFNQKFVADVAGEWIDLIHTSGKKTMMFYGDHWIGAELYGPYFQQMKLDAVVCPALNGQWFRITSDIPGSQLVEIRIFPYFFPDVFCPGGDPIGHSRTCWTQVRRAMLRKPIDRMGYGGYLSLAMKFPDFIDHVSEVCNEFREILRQSQKTKPFIAPVKIGIVNCWGKIRSWQNTVMWYEKNYQEGYMESLSGLPFEIEFLSFEDIIENGIPEDICVLINEGQADTAWSGGYYWKNPKVVATIRKWIYQGGGFIGIGEPTAHHHQGRFFQLEDVLGVQKEIGSSKCSIAADASKTADHFILQGQSQKEPFMNFTQSHVFPASESTQVLYCQKSHVLLSTNQCSDGRAVYFADLPYSLENTRLLQRAIFWAAGKESELTKWYSSNIYTECAAYPEVEKVVVINNSDQPQETQVLNGERISITISLDAYGFQWFDFSEFIAKTG